MSDYTARWTSHYERSADPFHPPKQVWRKTYQYDPQQAAANTAWQYQHQADSQIGGSVKSAEDALGYADKGIDAINGLNDPQNGQYISKANKNYDFATDISHSMLDTAGKVANSGHALNEDAGVLQGYGNTMWGQGNTLWGQGQNLLGQGQSLMDLDANAGGMIGKYVGWLNTIDPNRYVSMAASDVQNSFTNAQGQLDRTLSRAGSDASSTRTAAAQQQMAQSLAAALAGAKSRARVQGLKDQGAALQAALGQAQSMIESGGKISSSGIEAETQAGALQTEAGKLHTEAGNMFYKSGDIQGKAGDVAIEAGKLMTTIANLSMDKAKTLVAAYGNATDAANQLARIKANAGDYYAKVSQGFGSAAMKNNASSRIFGAESRNANSYVKFD